MEPATLAERVAARPWYHTMELAPGVTTKGFFDLRTVPAKLPIPASLTGKRCLDVASSDGFWAFELARRGGDVVSVDLGIVAAQDWQGPPGINARRVEHTGTAQSNFEFAREVLGLDVERHDLSVYDIDPELLGTFDFVFMGNIIMHLSDPARALRAVREVVRTEGGELLSCEGISLPLTVLRPFTPAAQLWHQDEPRWWTHNKRGHRRIIEAGGFTVVGQGGPFFQPLGPSWNRGPDRIPRRPRELAFWLFTRHTGAASSWVRARPRQLAA